MSMSINTMTLVLASVEFPGTKFIIKNGPDEPYLQLRMEGRCNVTGSPLEWTSRKWKLSEFMTKSELVQTAFLAVMTAIEHETREQFRYKGRAIFGPHFNVERLVTLADEPSDTR